MKKYATLFAATLLIILAAAFTNKNVAPPESWKVTTIAGWEEDNKTMDGTGQKAHFTWEMGSCAIDAADNLYVIDQINLRKMDTETKVTSLFGLGAMDENYYDLKLKELPGKDGVCIDKDGNIYVASNKDHAIYKIYPDKKVELYAGAEGYKGTDDGNRLEAEFTYPRRLCIDKAGNIYVTTDYSVRKIAADGKVTTMAGKAAQADFKPGLGKDASLREMRAIAVDSKGNVYIPQNNNNGGGSCIAKISPAGVVSNFVGDISQWEKEGISPDGTGKAARFMQINALAVDKDDNLVIGEISRVRKATPVGVVTTLAGNKTKDWRDAVGTKAMFRNIGGLSVDSKGNILVSDQFCIRKMEKQ
ncbi:MAG: hypothetical protein QM687_06270 [Ferruginibacter sp.]